MKYVWRIFDFLLYSHIFIASCAIATIFLSEQYFCCYEINLFYYIFISAGTLLIYNLHRLFSYYKMHLLEMDVRDRFRKIQFYEWWYILTSGLALIACAYTFITFSREIQFLLVIPSIISALYVLPIFPGHKRLRDFNFLKIFLIAFCWSWLCCVIPLQYSNASQGLIISLGLEKFFFIFAIALPFDFRDINLDKQQSVETIVSEIGYRNSMGLAIGSLLLAIVIVAVLALFFQLISIAVFYGFLLSYALIALLLSRAFHSHNDYYYTFAIDGSMWIVLICVLLFEILV